MVRHREEEREFITVTSPESPGHLERDDESEGRWPMASVLIERVNA